VSLESLYARLPYPLQEVALAGIAAHLRWQRFGGEFAGLLREAEAATFAGPAELRAIRERVWNERSRQAVAAVEAYGRRSLALDEVAGLPVLTKADVMGRLGSFLRAGYPRWRRVATHTSGTTGTPLHFPVTLFVERRNYAHVWRYRRWHGIGRREVCAVFGSRPVVAPGRKEAPFWQPSPIGRSVLYSQFHLGPRTARLYLEDIRRRGIRWVHGYPSLVGLLARLGIEAGLEGSTQVRWVTVSSEVLLASQRRAIRTMFGVEPRQQYGMAESVAFISECPEGALHVDDEYSLVEFLPVPANPGAHRIVGTSLDNEVFPLLRYDLGDLVRLGGEPCPCGRSGRVVASIEGRCEDLLLLRDGSWVAGGDFFQSSSHIAEAQVLQRTAGAAIVRIVPAPGFGDADEEAVRASFRGRVGDRLDLRFEYVESLERTRAGKLQHVVSELPEGKAERPT